MVEIAALVSFVGLVAAWAVLPLGATDEAGIDECAPEVVTTGMVEVPTLSRSHAS